MPLEVGVNDSSLMDDDDDCMMENYFGSSTTTSSSSFPAGQADGPWRVSDASVPTLPSFYPLEKTSTFVAHASASAVADRVAGALRARSVAASFDARGTKADCVSKNHVEFRVRLYRGQGDYSHGVIVEVQRLAGFDLTYTKDVQAILDAAEGKTFEDQFQEVPEASLFCEESGSSSHEEGNDCFSPLKIISSLLCPQGGTHAPTSVEAQQFALASLASLTSPHRMGISAARRASLELLESQSLSALRAAICTCAGSPAPSQDKLQCLEILANAVAAYENPSQAWEVLSQNFGMPDLVSNIQHGAQDPHAARLSCSIIKSTFASHQVSSAMKSALLDTLKYAERCHAELEEQSRLCLECL